MIKHFWKQWCARQDGATAIEYVLLAAGVSLAIIGTIFLFGDHLYDFMDGLQVLFSR